MIVPAGRRAVTILALAGAMFAPLLVPDVAAAGSHSRVSLLDIENDVMCTVCNEPLAVAQSPEAYRERAFIETLIAKGETKSEIEHQLVLQYGTAVLGRPPAHGFNLTVYVLPPAIVGLGLLALAYTLPRWRRRAAAARAHPAPAGAVVDPTEKRRLEDELRRYGG